MLKLQNQAKKGNGLGMSEFLKRKRMEMGFKLEDLSNGVCSVSYLSRIENTKQCIIDNSNRKYIVFYNNNWLGVTSATKELFENLVDCGELYRKEDVKKIGDTILDANIEQVIFSSFAFGWKNLAIYLKNNNNKIKLKNQD